MRAKKAQQVEARQLRAEGWALRRIAGELDVALSSVSVWVRDVPSPNSPPPPRPIQRIPGRQALRVMTIVDCVSDLRRCGKCHLLMPLSNFGKHPKGHQWWCKDCFRAYFARRGHLHRDQTHRARQRRRSDGRKLINRRFAAGCSDCGERDSLVLEFDHTGSKSDTISLMIREAVSVARVRAELEKCDVVCVNCHRRRTYSRSPLYWRSQPERLETNPHLARGERRNLIYIRDLLSASACIDCGVTDLQLLEFDHLRDKAGNVSAMARDGCSLERLKREIGKCAIRCGNCHRRRTITVLRESHSRARKLAVPP